MKEYILDFEAESIARYKNLMHFIMIVNTISTTLIIAILAILIAWFKFF
ncbi:hypothetical protein IJ531_06205 [bacterium]|nr:hypothetical protein [bacterium]